MPTFFKLKKNEMVTLATKPSIYKFLDTKFDFILARCDINSWLNPQLHLMNEVKRNVLFSNSKHVGSSLIQFNFVY